MNKLIAVLLVLLSFGLSAFFYNQLPNQIATHWNISGQVDGYSSKLVGVFIIPLISLFVLALLFAIPYLDPLKENIKQFQEYYSNFIIVISVFFLYLDAIILWQNLGNQFNFIQYLIPGFALMIYYAGSMLEKAKMNWFIGIRTPWTLSSPSVWNKTHYVGGKVYKAVAIISLLGVIFPSIAVWILLGPLLSSSLGLFVYSYLEFQKREQNK